MVGASTINGINRAGARGELQKLIRRSARDENGGGERTKAEGAPSVRREGCGGQLLFFLEGGQVAFCEGGATLGVIEDFQGIFGLEESHGHMLLDELDFPSFGVQAGLRFVLGLGAELTQARVDCHDEIVIAAIRPHPFPIHRELGLNLIAQHGWAHDNENGFVRNGLGFRVRAFVRARAKFFRCRAAGRATGRFLGAH